MQVGVLLNHYEPHQVPHVAPYAFALSRLRPDWRIRILCSTGAEAALAARIGASYPGHAARIEPLAVPLHCRLVDPVSRHVAFYRKQAVRRANRRLLAGFDALVVPEITSLSLREEIGGDAPALIFTGHGAGDFYSNPFGMFDPRLARFDLVLLQGGRIAADLRRHGGLDGMRYAVAGYPKFETAGAPAPRFFDNADPVVLYNPTQNPRGTSWHRFGEAVLDAFAARDDLNLIFAPHALLFKRSLTRGARLPRRVRSGPRLTVTGDRAPLADLARLARGARRRGIPAFALARADLCTLAAGGTGAMDPHGGKGLAPPGPRDLGATRDYLIAAMGVERGQGPFLDAAGGHVAGLLRRPAGRFVPWLRRVPDLAALGHRLGAPSTILCLGNGPTGADPALAGMAHDALFRVNHQWMRRGVLARPDLIFPGVRRSMRAAGRVPVCVATAAKERALIATRLTEPWHGPATYAVAEEVAAGIVPPVPGPLRPTTGAWMIAVAVALRPRRLVVAGMDMFSHPAGAYPGDGTGAEVGANAYAPSHDFETDAAFIRACLAAYAGEIVTLSPAFADLAGSVASPRFRLIRAEAGRTGPPAPAGTAPLRPAGDGL